MSFLFMMIITTKDLVSALCKQQFEDCRVNGEVVVNDTGEHKSFKMFGKSLCPVIHVFKKL